MNAAAVRRRDSEATMGAILSASRELFAAKGYAATSTSEIARSAGVTKSLIHHHFGGKEQLWICAIDSQFEEEQEMLLGILQSEVIDPDFISTSMARIFGLYRDRPDVVRMLMWQYLDGGSLEECPIQALKLGVELIGRGQELGLVRSDVDPANVLMIFLGMLEFWFQARLTKGTLMGRDLTTPEADEAYLADAIAIFLNGAAAPTP